MRREERLTQNRQFSLVYRQGKGWANNLIVLRALPNELGVSRYGFVVGRRVGKAVVRNRVKRLMREITRLTPTPRGWDLVFIARGAAATATHKELKAAMERLLWRAQLLGRGGV